MIGVDVADCWLLLLGSNRSDDQRVHEAITALGQLGRLQQLTPIRRFAAHDGTPADFYNVLLLLQLPQTRADLLSSMKTLEDAAGRRRDTAGTVSLDIDLLAVCEGEAWRADPHALAKQEFAKAPVRALLDEAGIDIDPSGRDARR